MKKITAILILICFVTGAKTQGLSNFISQKEADIKYMLAQIAELQTYIGYVEGGYAIAQKGLTAIGQFKKGEFDLHQTFFTSLSNVNPAIRNYSKVADIISLQVAIVSFFKKIMQLKNMSPGETDYLQSVYKNMSAACTKNLAALIDILTDGTLAMKDNERVQRIDAIYANMKDRYAFTQSFSNDTILLSMQRQNDLNEIDFEKKLN